MTQPFIGQISMFAGTFAPRTWAFCQGQTMSIQQNAALFSLLGTTYGGNGTTTFNLPDLRGRIPIGQGTGTGLSPRAMGQTGGEENVTITTQTMPAHSHTMNASTTAANASAISPIVLTGDTTAQNGAFYTTLSSASTAQPFPAGTVSNAGGSQPHGNIMPSLVISYIIALQGVFPSRN